MRRSPLLGLALRDLLVVLVLDARRPITVGELARQAEAIGTLDGRPGKAVSDALRWEVRKGRIRRLDRGVYAAGTMPRSTEWTIRKRVDALRADRGVPRARSDDRKPRPVPPVPTSARPGGPAAPQQASPLAGPGWARRPRVPR